MKVLAYIHAYIGHGREAGAETTIAGILESLVRNGHDVTVLLSQNANGGKDYTINGVNVLVGNNKKVFAKIAGQYDIVVTHLECSEQASFVCRAKRMPVCHVVHNTFWQTEGYLAEGCDLAIYNTDWAAEHHNGAVGNPIARVCERGPNSKSTKVMFRARKSSSWDWVVAHPHVDPSLYKTDGPHDSVGFVNFHSNKNPSIFFAMARAFPSVPFLGLLGGYGHQELEWDLPNVEFVSNTADIKGEFYARTKILLVPSHYESFGRVALEAAASGIPTVASGAQGLRELLGPTGLFASADQPVEWESALKTLLGSKVAFDYYSSEALKVSEKWSIQAENELKQVNDAMETLVKRAGR